MTGRFGKPDSKGRSSGRITGRRGKALKPPAGEPWVWVTREMLASDAWRSLSINARRFMDFLMIEHMNHAGTENGGLKATYQQLEAFGLSVNHISDAIAACDAAGLVDCRRGGMRVATTYRLTWLPDRDGTPASNRWKLNQNQKSALQTEGSKPSKQRAEAPDLPSKRRADPTPQTEGPSIFILVSEESSTASPPLSVGTKPEVASAASLSAAGPTRPQSAAAGRPANDGDPYQSLCRRIAQMVRLTDHEIGRFVIDRQDVYEAHALGKLSETDLYQALHAARLA